MPSNEILAPLKAQLKGPLLLHLGPRSTLSMPPSDSCIRKSNFCGGRCESWEGQEGRAEPIHLGHLVQAPTCHRHSVMGGELLMLN